MAPKANLLEFTDNENVDAYSRRINKNWTKAVDKILYVAKICAEAASELDADEKKLLIKSLKFGPATFSKLVRIGSDKRLRASHVKRLLPPNYSIIYSATKLDDEKFSSAIEQGVLHPKATREELEVWATSKSKAKPSQIKAGETIKFPANTYATVRITRELSAKEWVGVEDCLKSLRDNFSAEILYSSELPYYDDLVDRLNAEQSKQYKRTFEILKRLVKRKIKQLKKQKGKFWGFLDDEVDVDGTQDIDEIKFILNTVGIEDQFDGFLHEAELKTPQSKKAAKLEALLALVPVRNNTVAIFDDAQKISRASKPDIRK